MRNNENRKWLHQRLQEEGYDIGEYNDFDNSLQDKENADWYYSKAKKIGLEVGERDYFNKLMGLDKPNSEQSTGEPYTHEYDKNGNLIGGTAYDGKKVEPENLPTLQQLAYADVSKDGKLNFGKPGFGKDEASALYPMSSTSLKERLSDPRIFNKDMSLRAVDEAREEEEIDKSFVSKPMNTAKDVMDNFGARFTNTQRGIELGEELAKRTKDIQDKYVNEYLASDDYKALSSMYKGEELAEKANEQFGVLYGDAINKEIIPYQQAYNDELQRRYGKQIDKELNRINKEEAGTHARELMETVDSELEDVEKRITERTKVVRNENWKPGMPSSRDDKRLAELRGERAYLEGTKELIDDSQKILNAVEAEKDGNFFVGLGRGIRDSVFDIDTWTMGLSDLVGGLRLRTALEKAEKGEKLSSAEERLLDASVNNMAVNYYYRNDLGRGYQAGEVTGQSIPFMLEFIVNPVSASGNAIAKSLLNYGMKRFAVGALGKNATKVGTRLVADAIAAGGVTATSGIGNVIGGTVDRLNRNYEYGLDEEGNLKVTNTNKVGLGEALGKSAATEFLERQSEMIFNAFKGAPSLFKGVEMSLPGGVNTFMNYISNSRVGELWRGIKNNTTMRELAQRAQFHGLGEEYLEEVYNNFANIPLGEMTFEEATDLEQNLVTFLGLAPTQVMFGAIGGIGYGIERYKARRDMGRTFGRMTDEQKRKLMELQEMGKLSTNRDIAIFLAETIKDESLTPEQKRDEIEYAYNLAKQNAINEVGNVDVEDTIEAENAQIDAATDPKTGLYGEVQIKTKDARGEDVLSTTNVYAEKIYNGEQYLLIEREDGKKDWVRPNEQYIPESYQKLPAEQVKSINEEMIREEAAVQAERESKYAPEVVNYVPQPQEQVTDANGQVLTVASVTPDGVTYLDEQGQVNQIPLDVWRDLMQAQIDAQEAQQAQAAMVEESKQSIVDNLQPKPMNDGTGRIMQPKAVEGNKVIYDITDGNGIILELNASMDVSKYNEPVGESSGESVGEQVNAEVNSGVNNQGASGENVSPVEVEQPQAPAIPTKEDGSIDFVSYGKEGSFRVLGERYGEKMPNKVAVTARALADDLKKAQQKLDKAEEAYDNAPIGRERKAEQARDKARQELEAVKREADFWADMDADIKAAQQRREEILNPRIAVESSNEPMTADEFVANQLAIGNIVLNKDDYMRETGYGSDEANAMNGGGRKLFAEDGMTIQEAGERLAEIDAEEGGRFFSNDSQSGRDALISLLGSVKNRKELNQYIANKRKAQAERDAEGLRNEAERAVMDANFSSLEDFVLQMEAAEVENPFLEDRADEIMAIFAEEVAKYEQSLNNTENEQGRTNEVAEGSDTVLPEEQSDDTGGTEERSESERVGDGIADESEGAYDGEQEQINGRRGIENADNGVQEWYSQIHLSGELDQNNSPFISSPSGGIDFGNITEIHNIPSAPIRLSMGDVENGYIHINRRHGKQIQKAGFNSIEEFVKYVVDNFTRIQEGDSYKNASGGTNNTYLVQLQDKHNNTLFIQLSRNGEYWNVNSAGVFNKSYGNKKKNIWSASEVQNNNPAVVSDGLQSEPNADNGSTSNGTPSNSIDKDSNLSGENKENRENISLKQREGESVLQFAERIHKEELRRKPLRERAKQWSGKLGVKVRIMESLDDVTNPSAKRVISRGQVVTGWFEESTGEVCLYMPNIASESEVDATYIHEVVSHKGLRGLLGDKFDTFCDEVWDMMSDADRLEFMSYPGVSHLEGKEKSRAAADEYIAHLAENIDVTESAWSRFTELLKKFLKALGIEPEMTNADIANTVKKSYQRLISIAGAEDDVRGEGMRFRFSKTPQEFDAVQKEAVEKKGIVMPGLNEAVVDVLGINKHNFNGNLKQAREEAKQWATENYQGKEFALPDDGGSYTIGKKAINKYVDKTSIEKSDNAMIHLSALKELPNIISSSVTGEIHADYKKGENGERSAENGVGDKGLLVHRMFGAVELDEKVYRVKTTMNEYRDPLASNTPHSYEVTEIELIESSSTPSLKDDSKPLNVSNNSITGAKLLNGVEKSYDNGKKLLDESEKTRFRRVFHGSGASFDRFDHSFMSTGEGNQSFGWGSYVTDVKDIGEKYAGLKADNSPLGANALRWIEENSTYEDFLAKGEGKRRNWAIRHAKDYLKELKEDGASEDVIKAYEQDLADAEKALSEESYNRTRENMVNSLNRHLYEVEIPDDNGTNYIAWDKMLPKEQAERIKEAVRDSDFFKTYKKEYGEVAEERLEAWTKTSGGRVYKLLGNFTLADNDADKTISKLLSDAGFVGFKYPSNYLSGGNLDGSNNYVIFNENDLEIVEHIRFRFIGERGARNLDKAEEATTRLDNLGVAREMVAAEKDAKSIKMATGWERGADGKWRYEVDDNIDFELRRPRKAELKKVYDEANERYYNLEMRVPVRTPKNASEEDKQRIKDMRKELAKLRKAMNKAFEAYYDYSADWATLGDFLGKDNQLFKEYPELADYDVSFLRDTSKLSQGLKGSFIPEYKTIWLDDARPKGDVKSSLVHEIQHAIQEIEGFAHGGTPQMFASAKYQAEDWKANFREFINRYGFEDWEKNLPFEELMKYGKIYKGLFGGLHRAFIENVVEDESVKATLMKELDYVKNAYDKFYHIAGGQDAAYKFKDANEWYRSLSGEVEARNVQQRMGMTDEQRKRWLADETEDVAREDQIFLQNTVMDEGTRFRMVKEPAVDYISQSEEVVDVPQNEVKYTMNNVASELYKVSGNYLRELYKDGVLGKVLRGEYAEIDQIKAKADYDKAKKHLGEYLNELVWMKYQSTEPAQDVINDVIRDVEYSLDYYRDLALGKDVWRTKQSPRFRIVDKKREAIQKEVDEFTSKYNSKPVEILDLTMTDEAIEDVVEWTQTASDLRTYINSVPVMGGYVKEIDKILIFADNMKLERMEESMFHENLHPLVDGGEYNHLVDKLYNEAKDDETLAYARKMSDKEVEFKRPLEFFVYAVSYGQKQGNLDDVLKYFGKQEQDELLNLLNINGYDYKNEQGRRRGLSGILDGISRGEKNPERVLQHQEGGQESNGRVSPTYEGQEPSRKGKAERLRTLFGKVADMGLDGVLGSKEYTRLMVDIYKELPEDVRTSLADDALRHYGGSVAPAVSDYVNVNGKASLWDKIAGFIREALRKVGIELDINGNDAKYILWRSRKPLNRVNLLDVAEDIDMRFRLKVGEFEDSPTNGSDIPRGGGSRFRVANKLNIRDEYEATIKKGGYQAREAVQDSMLSLRRVQELIEKVSGKKLRDFENAWMHENRLSSVVQSAIHEMERKFYKPMTEAVKKLMGAANIEQEQVADYLMLKHAIERNREMAVRKALTDNEGKIDRDKLNDWYEEKRKIRNDANLDTWRKKQEAMDDAALMFGADMSQDYSGLTSMFDTDDLADCTERAYNEVEALENAHPNETEALGKAIKAMAQNTLDESFGSGLMSKSVYDELSNDMYDYYIPLRGFDETTSDEVYAYMDNERGAFNAPLVRAKGRSSKADNPLAYLKSVAESGIIQGERNKMKQTFLNMVVNHPSDLVSVREGVWAIFNPATGEWEAASFPESKVPRNASPADVEAAYEQWEADMERRSQTDPNVKKVSEAADVPYRVVGNRMNQHQVIVKRLGKSYTLTINGNPRLAMALNGLTNPNNKSNDGKVSAYVSGKIDALNRNLSAWYTTRNPDFVASNFMRDTFYTNTIVRAKEGNAYANRFHRQYAKLLMPGRMIGLFAKYENGTLDLSNPMERDFHEFMTNGGETGYSNLKDLEHIKKQIAKDVKGGRLEDAKSLLDKLDLVNRAVENTARFAAYRTSRQQGRSISRSVFDAKEISVNFNKKGSGGTFFGATGQTGFGNLAAMVGAGGRAMYVFFNAAIQGTTNLMHVMKVNPMGTGAGLGVMFLMGAVIPMLLGGDDEKDYYDLPEHVRRNHLVLPGAGDSWISIPLPIEYRIMYGMGELLTSWRTGHERGSNIGKKMLSLTGQALPLNFLEEGMDAFVPSALSPLWQVYNNRSWTGLPIYKDYAYDEQTPEYTKAYKNVNRGLYKFTKALYNWTFDEENQEEGIDLNPAVIEHIGKGYFGGLVTTLDNLWKTGEMVLGDREFDWRNIPIGNRIFKSGDERTKEKRIQNEYFKYADKLEFLQSRERFLRKTKDGAGVPEADKLEADEDYKILLGSDVYKKYITDPNGFKAKKKTADKIYRQWKEEGYPEELEKKYYKALEEANKAVRQ